jgi:nicotinate-nucleotide pyrophosphorylase (carboxylating)
MHLTGDLIDHALAEDVGPGDVTVRIFCDPSRLGVARIVARVPCVVAGVAVATEVFRRVDMSLSVREVVTDGTVVVRGDTLLEVSGRLGSILTAERTVLNFLQRLSAVATLTREYVSAVEGTGCRILDTRKTTPGWRLLEKAAVVAGGGTNHRLGLYDMVMVKDNHLAGGLTSEGLAKGIRQVKEDFPGIRVEVEADTLDQVREFYQVPGVDIIMLDNMPADMMRVAVNERPEGILLEASGGIDLRTVRSVAETGVDFISVGALTHSAGSVDLSLELESNET